MDISENFGKSMENLFGKVDLVSYLNFSSKISHQLCEHSAFCGHTLVDPNSA